MCPPGLHLSLCIGLSLFNHLEQEWECFDLQVATHLRSSDVFPDLPSPAVTEFNKLLQSLHTAEEELAALKDGECQLKSWLISIQLQLEAVPVDTSAIGQQILASQQAGSALSMQASAKSAEVSSLKEKMKRIISNGHGPCARELEKRLQQIGVCRQAYFSGSFVGNHIDKMCNVRHVHGIVSL